MWEKELLGLYISGHPYREYAARLSGVVTPIVNIGDFVKEKKVRIAGVVTQAKKIRTKNNENMLFAEIEDLTGKCEAIVFPRVLNETVSSWDVDRVLVVSGRPQDKDGQMKVLVETAYEITPQNIDEIAGEEDRAAYNVPRTTETLASEANPNPDALGTKYEVRSTPDEVRSISLHVRATLPESVILKLRRVFDEHVGIYQVYFLIDDVDGQRRIKSSAKIAWSEEIVKQIEAILGPGTVKIA